jgi:hypothetical protein
MTKADKLKMCRGCRNDFYNGNNSCGVKECWSLGSAKVVMRKEVHIDQRPPWTQPASKFLDCYHADRYVYVNPKQTC